MRSSSHRRSEPQNYSEDADDGDDSAGDGGYHADDVEMKPSATDVSAINGAASTSTRDLRRLKRARSPDQETAMAGTATLLSRVFSYPPLISLTLISSSLFF